MKKKLKCPNCGTKLNIGSLLGKLSAKKRKLSSAEAREMALKMHEKRRLSTEKSDKVVGNGV